MFWFKTRHPESGEPIEVEAAYHGRRRGLRDRYGAPLEPDEEAELVVCRVWNRAGEEMEFSGVEEELVAEGVRVVEEKGRKWNGWT
ncbi:MAG: hypothetical protein WCP06_03010 [Verrucomicrobiota bacterium]